MPFKLRNINKLAFNKQMALPLKFKSIKNRENYLVSKCNVEAVKLIENSTFWQNSKKTNSIPGAIVYGPKGSGKTHLSSILKQEIDCVYLTSLSNDCLEQVTEGKNFILDNFICTLFRFFYRRRVNSNFRLFSIWYFISINFYYYYIYFWPVV